MTNKDTRIFSPSTTTLKALIFISVTLLHFLTSYACKSFSPIYPAIAIGSLLIFGTRYFFAIFLGTIFTQWIAGIPLAGMFGISIGNTLEAIIGAKLISHLLKKSSLKNYSEFIAICVGLGIASLFRASIGVFTLYQFEKVSIDTFSQKLLSWWCGSFIAGLIVLPLILELEILVKEKKWKDFFNFNKIMFFIILNVTGLIFLTFVFLHDLNQAYAWFWCIALLFSGLYLGHIYARITAFILGFGVVFLSLKGFGSFDYGVKNINMLYIYILLFGYGFSTLLAKPMKSELTENKLFIITMAVTWPIVCGIVYITSLNEREAIKKDLTTIVEKTIEGIEENVADAEDLLLGASGLIVAYPNVTTDQWKEYIDSHIHSKTFSVVNGLGVIKSSAKNNNLLISLYGSPLPTQVVPGLDFGVDPALLKGANQARVHGHTFASETTQLMHDGKLHNSFILFHPIRTSDAKKKEFLGWIFAPVVTEYFFNKALELYNETLYINIKEGTNNIYNSQVPNSDYPRSASFALKKLANFYGNNFIFDFYPREDFFIRHSRFTVPVSGLLVSIYFLIVCFLVELFSFGIRADALVKERTKEIEATRNQLVQATKMSSLGDMAAGMAHQINNPLTIISGRLQIMMAKSKEPGVQVELEKMLANTEKISQIVNSLRKFAGPTDNNSFELASINRMINHSLALCADAIRDNFVDVKMDLTSDLQINCQPPQISQVIFHLINNSCDAVARLKKRWILIKTVTTDHQTIQIIVTDSGNGIPDEIADKLMQPFYTTKDVGIGKGIDLSISLGIMRLHNGSLTLDRKSPNTTFIIELPV